MPSSEAKGRLINAFIVALFLLSVLFELTLNQARVFNFSGFEKNMLVDVYSRNAFSESNKITK